MSHRPTGADEWIVRYGEGPSRLEAALTGLDNQGLDAGPAEGGWTIRQIVHHVADGDDIWKTFIKMALGNESATFALDWYWCQPQDEWAVRWQYAARDIAPSLALFHANRAHIVQLLQGIPRAGERSLSVAWPQRPEERVSVAWVVEMQTRHVVGHIEDIRRIRSAHGL